MKCRCNGLRLIVMVWETFGGFAPKTHIMIRKITIRYVDKHNQPQGQTHLPEQLASFRRASARHWGAADCLRVCQLNAGFVTDTSDSLLTNI
jgi:hypothetical protein